MSKLKSSFSNTVNNFADFSADDTTRTIIIDGKICGGNHDVRFLAALAYFEQHNKKPVKVLLHTVGGEVDAALTIAARMISSPLLIEIDVLGCCMSAGIILCAAGDVRRGSSLSQFMHHPTSGAVYGTIKEMRQALEAIASNDSRIYKFLESRTKMPSSWWREQEDPNLWFGSEEAISYGLLHEMVPEKMPIVLDSKENREKKESKGSHKKHKKG